MHLNLPVSLLFIVLSVYTPSSALPFIARRKTSPASLAARATYSIVPIDGSGDDSGSGSTGTPATIIETIIVTPTLTTKTVVESSPPVTDTIVITADPTTHTVSTTISVIDIRSTTNVVTTTVTEDDDAPTSTLAYPSASSTSTIVSVTTTPSSTSAIPSPTPTETSAETTASTPIWTTYGAPVPSWSWSSSTSYDDGVWHTSYPAWNSTTGRRFARQP
ncbi:hypothetical protein AAE478_000748 [Parahypoxylon ruwenzoriense]